MLAAPGHDEYVVANNSDCGGPDVDLDGGQLRVVQTVTMVGDVRPRRAEVPRDARSVALDARTVGAASVATDADSQRLAGIEPGYRALQALA